MRERAPLLLLRHGDCGAAVDYCVGQWDLPLSPQGIAQAEDIAARWPGPAPAQIISSDLARTRQTAEILARRWQARLTTDPRLREICLGDWQGQTWDHIHRSSPESLRHWGANWVRQAPPGGESAEDVIQRVAAWWQTGPADEQQTVAVVAHAGSLRALLCYLGERPIEQMFEFSIDCAAPFSLIDKARSGPL